MAATTWLGSHICDFCHSEITGTLYDAKTKHGPWATMCHDCFTKHGYGKLGIGLGQRYHESDGKFTKVEG